MRFKTRYRFWHVVLGIIGVGMIAALFYIVSTFSSEKQVLEESTDSKTDAEHSALGAFLMFAYIVTFFYFTLNYYYQHFSLSGKIKGFIKLTVIILFISFFYHSFLYFAAPRLLNAEYASLGKMFSSILGHLIPMLIVSILISYVTVLREALKQRRILEAQKMQLEMEISQANFNFLKSQINPHFLHNTLNFLYAKSLPFSSELSEGILTLSDIMRYALSKGNQKDGKAPLKDEVEHLHNVIKISQLRYNNQLFVNFDVEGSPDGALIVPFVLITLVENAFMHGDLKDASHPIDIRLRIRDGQLSFYCGNKKRMGPKQPSTGIGLANIRKRLDLAYGDKYRYVVKDDADYYSTQLTIYQL